MNWIQNKRFFLYGLALVFAAASYYAYTLVPMSTTIEGEVEGVFLLSASLGAVIALLYSFVSSLSLLSRVSGDVLAFDMRVPVSIISLSGGLALFYAYHSTGVGWFFIPVPALATFTILALRGIYPFQGRAKAPSIVPLTDDGLVKFVTSREGLRKLAEYRARRFSSLLAQSGTIGNPYVLAAKSISQTVFAAAILVPLGIVLGIFVWLPLALLSLLPAMLYAYPEMRLRDKAAERRDRVERELPFFSILVNVLGSAGVPLYNILNEVADTRIFDSIRREALLIRRDVTIFGMNPLESFERLASQHPSRKFSSFLYGYTSKVRSGGDIPSYLLGESGSLLRELEESWTRYAGRAGIIGSMMITVFGVIPMLLLIVGVFSPATSVVDLTVFTAVGVPFFAILLVFMAGRMQPVGEEPLVGNAKLSLLLSLPGLGVGLVSDQVWLGLASILFLFCTLYGFTVISQRREMKEISDALPEFLKDLTEFKRQEYDINRAILAMASRNKYTPSFDKVLRRVAAQLKTGTPLNEIGVDPKDRLARVVLFVLGQMAYSGGGTVDTLFQLSTYTSRVVEMKRSTMAEMRPYLWLSYLSPVMIAFGVAFITGIMGSFGSLVRPGLSTIHVANLSIGVVSPQLKEVSNFLIVTTSAALGIISAKMVDFTVRNTLRASTNVVIATIVAFLLTQVDLVSLFHISL